MEEINYVIINSHSLLKARTGGILARLLVEPSLELVATRMLSFTKELTQEYADCVDRDTKAYPTAIQKLLKEYILTNMNPEPKTGRQRRGLVLLFKGENAVKTISDIVGRFGEITTTPAETIRDVYADIIYNEDESIKYFEPAVFTGTSVEGTKAELAVLAKHSAKQDGIVNYLSWNNADPKIERSLVLLKPDNFRIPSARAGNLIKHFANLGLYLVGTKVIHMSVDQAEKFYEPIRDRLQQQIGESVALKTKELIESSLGYRMSGDNLSQIAVLLGPTFGEQRFHEIVKFMVGKNANDCRNKQDRSAPGSNKCVALVYEGYDAIQKIRTALGPTDPAKAPPGSVRREYGMSIMSNAAHASDSVESAEREIKVMDLKEEHFTNVIENFYSTTNNKEDTKEKGKYEYGTVTVR
jgi:nucleoside diphosphate kinase